MREREEQRNGTPRERSRRAYRPPRLVDYGDFRELTRATSVAGTKTDANFVQCWFNAQCS